MHIMILLIYCLEYLENRDILIFKIYFLFNLLFLRLHDNLFLQQKIERLEFRPT